ncbi:SO2930 family diheme c-type cytochrome [Isoalcanivorax indicus]|uniref:SO2930 family diheme c-type cytochrome n=1 Tax=Isoalcanivorax indicus TaxID=2202653 RepID=UPI000DBACBDD|nr:SO2930 family diheme c-type cytochrome [Isoalcanivorax indicus]
MSAVRHVPLCLGLAALLLSACGGSGGSGGGSNCEFANGCINRDALMRTNAPTLSTYNLFVDPADPTANPRENGLRYELTTSLFSDYTSKYRFIFVPPGQHVAWHDQEAFDFPVGTVITKTFSMPEDTAFTGPEHETVLETRLLIRRSGGWVALPYVWNAERTEAVLRVTGASIPVSLIHNGAQRAFTYRVPDSNQCAACHQKRTDGVPAMSLIGPKARFLNREITLGDQTVSQLQHWIDAGVLTGAPPVLAEVDTVPAYENEDASLIDGMTDAALLRHAKGYLDINCAHCHRQEGSASTSGLFLEFWRDFAEDPERHGVCKRPIAYGGGHLSYDIVPGDAEASILFYRMNTVAPGHSMPTLGKATLHDEGLALVRAWIDRMPEDDCNGS